MDYAIEEHYCGGGLGFLCGGLGQGRGGLGLGGVGLGFSEEGTDLVELEVLLHGVEPDEYVLEDVIGEPREHIIIVLGQLFHHLHFAYIYKFIY